jgi:hypothetical protein
MDKAELERLRNLVRDFTTNNAVLRDTLRENRGNFEDPRVQPVWDSTVSIVVEIKQILGEQSLLQIDDVELRKTLRKIRDNGDFLIFNICKILYGEDYEFEPKDYETLYDEMHVEQHNQASPYDIIRGRIQIGTLILSKSVPSLFQWHLERIRDCYCFNFKEAASIWSRSLLEVAIKKALSNKPGIRRDPKVTDMREKDGLDYWIRKCRPFYPSLIETMHDIRNGVNDLLHAQEIERRNINHLKIIKKTFQVVEQLFEDQGKRTN